MTLLVILGAAMLDGCKDVAQAVKGFLCDYPFQTCHLRVMSCSVNDYQELVDLLGERYVVQYLIRPHGRKDEIVVELGHEFSREVDKCLSMYFRLCKQPSTMPKVECLKHFEYSVCEHAGITVM